MSDDNKEYVHIFDQANSIVASAGPFLVGAFT
jgi:hypothetical protein